MSRFRGSRAPPSFLIVAGAPPAPPKPPHSKAAHFILQDGDALVDVKCADDESMKICADITLQILDKLVALPKH